MFVHADGKTQKSLDDCFRDLEQHLFGYGYGNGEYPVLNALKVFMAHVGVGSELPNSYDYHVQEKALTPPVTWLLINLLCKNSFITYGTSPRYGWLTDKGLALKRYVDSRTADQLCEVVFGIHHDPNRDCVCDGTTCDCVPAFFDLSCDNPFFVGQYDQINYDDPRWSGPFDAPKRPK